MIYSGLYGVLTHLIQSHNQNNQLLMSIDDLTYKFQLKRGTDGQNYVIIQLPFNAHNVTIMALSHGEYELKECHFTVYEGRGSEHSLIQPHFTGYYNSLASTHESSEWLNEKVNQKLTLRGYVSEGDRVCINSITASTLKKGKQKQQIQVGVPNFFQNELDKIKFKNHLLAYISPLMIFLRKTQTDLTLPRKQQYESLLKQACTLNAKFLEEKSEKLIKDCLKISKNLVQITASLASFSNGYGEWVSVRRIHQQQLEYYNAQLRAVIQVDKPELPELNEPYASNEDSKAKAQTNAVETIKTAAYDASEMPISELNRLLSEQLNPSAAQKLAGLIGDLNNKLFTTSALSTEQQYDFLDRILAAKHHLGNYYYQALLSDEPPSIMQELLAYLPNTPVKVVFQLIQQDNHLAIQALLQHDLVSIYSVADDGRPFYVHAYEQGRINSITLYVKLGIHPILMMIDEVSTFLNTTQIDTEQLRNTLIKYDEINVHLQKTLSVFDWDILLDNLVLTLRATKKDLLPSGNQVKHRSKPTLSDTTEVLNCLLSFLEILQQILRAFPREEFAVTSSNIPITSLKPLIDLLPKSQIKIVDILSILPMFNEILIEMQRSLSTFDPNKMNNLRQLVTQILGLGVNNENNDHLKKLNVYVRHCYNEIINSKDLARYSLDYRHALAINEIADRVHCEESFLMPLPETAQNDRSIDDMIFYAFHTTGDSYLKTLSTVSRGRKIRERIEAIINAPTNLSYDNPFECVRAFLLILNIPVNIPEEQIVDFNNAYTQCMRSFKQCTSSLDSLSVDLEKEAEIRCKALTAPELPAGQKPANVAKLQGLSLFSNVRSQDPGASTDIKSPSGFIR